MMKFFISSTFEDLKEYRRHTINYLKDLTNAKTGEIGAMEYFLASENTSKEVCLGELESSDVVIGIYGSRFGWEEKSTGRSMTEIEFDRAVELGKPILIFVTYQEKEEKQQRFISEKVFAQGKNCSRFNSLEEYAEVLHKSIKAYLSDLEGYSYKSIWDDIVLLRRIIEEDIGAGSLRMHIYEDGGENAAIEQIWTSVNYLQDLIEPIHDMYYACTGFPGGYEQPECFTEKLERQWDDFFLGLPNHLSAIRLAVPFLRLFQLQHRLLTEVWTEELRQEVINARDKYIEILGDSYHID